MKPLLAYDGGSVSMPANAGKSFDNYGVDKSGRVNYAFNALGYRSEEHVPAAPQHIYAVGCSHTFGLGLEQAASWPNRWRALYCQHANVPVEAVNLLNFSSVGASNRYIARTLLAQCEQQRPTLALVQFTYKNRMENLAEARGFNILPSILETPNLATFSAGERDQELFLRLRSTARDYYRFYTDEFGAAELLLNLLLVQNYCAQKKIPYLFLMIEPLPEQQLLRPLLAMIDCSRLLVVPQELLLEDVGHVPMHPGPVASQKLAAALFALYSAAEPRTTTQSP